MPYGRFVLPALGAIAVLTGLLLWRGLDENLVYYLTPSEAVARRAEFPDGVRFRLGGLVVEGTVAEVADVITFEMTDGGATIPIRLTATPPALFQQGIQVLVEGAWRGEEFAADLLLVKHDETYRTPEGQPYTPPAS